MTKEEAKTKLEDVAKNLLWGCGEYSEALDMAIKALEQESILDKIIEEISSLTLTDNGEDNIRTMAELYSFKITVLLIIAKYRQEV